MGVYSFSKASWHLLMQDQGANVDWDFDICTLDF